MSFVQLRLGHLLTEVMDMLVSLEQARDIPASQRAEVQLRLSLVSDDLEELVALVAVPNEPNVAIN